MAREDQQVVKVAEAWMVLALVCMDLGVCHGQRLTLDGIFGARTYRDGTGMFAVDTRIGLSPEGWALRPTAGVAAATDFLGWETELMFGAHGDLKVGTAAELSGGAGFSFLSRWGSEWDAGRSSGPYVAGAILFAPQFLSPIELGMDFRGFLGHSFVRPDGLEQEAAFWQWGVLVRRTLSR